MTTSGLSVDPDDLTKEGIEATGARVISYGAPVFPGAMFLVARLKGRYILGAPACVYFNTHTMLDILLPRIMAGERVTAAVVRKLALGGLCLHCDVCRYPSVLLRERSDSDEDELTIAILGAGEMASGIAHRLFSLPPYPHPHVGDTGAACGAEACRLFGSGICGRRRGGGGEGGAGGLAGRGSGNLGPARDSHTGG